ncbi:hypothetical protein ACHAPO_008356 [Fusarium lateritium]
MQNIDMVGAGLEQLGQTGILICVPWRTQILGDLDRYPIHLPASNNGNSSDVVERYIFATRNSVQGVTSRLEHGHILGYLRAVRDVLNLGANRPIIDTRGPVYRDPLENEELYLLYIARDLSSDKSVWDHEGDLVVKNSQEHKLAMFYLGGALKLVGKVIQPY